MSEFEHEHVMPAPADRVFAVAADVRNLNRWLPGEITVHPDGPESARVEVGDHDREVPADLDVRREQRRLEWAVRGDAEYTGWLQVEAADNGRSTALLHLSFHGDLPQNHGGRAAAEVPRQLSDACEKLARLVAAGTSGGDHG